MSDIIITIPDELFDNLEERAKKLSMSKDALIEKSLRIYLEHLDAALMTEEGIKKYRDKLKE